jgi:asparagine synthase (glutamine-hydrolysing)
LNAYAIFGKKCLQYFNGDFAFAIWDNQEKKLFCARDRVGIKPFYYTIQNNQFIFASDIKTIIASGLYTPQPDPEGLYLAMAFGIAPRPITAFRGVKALEQGTWLEIDTHGNITRGRYWDIPIGTQDHTMTEDEASELLEHELQEATRLRLIADVPVGTFMSGGVDSTTISAMASRFHPGIKAFTLAYEHNVPEMDETQQAIATAKINLIDHIVHKVNPNDSLKFLSQWIEGYEEPFYGLAANFVISKLVRDSNVTVVLNGLGGDELFAGYGYYRFAKFWPFVKIARPLSSISSLFSCSKMGRAIALGSLNSPDEFHTSLFSQSSDVYRQSLFVDTNFSKNYTISRLKNLYVKDKSFTDFIEALNYMDLMNYVGNHHVHRVDQFTMAHSVEGRFPFLDHNVIEAAFKIPSKYKIKSGVQKYVLRNVARKFIHPSCLSMKKKGFGLPLYHWMQGPLKSLVEDKLERLKQRRIINSQSISYIYKKYIHQKISHSKVWHLVALELWFERFIDQDRDFLRFSKFNF